MNNRRRMRNRADERLRRHKSEMEMLAEAFWKMAEAAQALTYNAIKLNSFAREARRNGYRFDTFIGSAGSCLHNRVGDLRLR